jgi:Tfp pilus assembly protein PilF
MPLSDVLAVPADFASRQTREDAELFYAESWALAEMLLRSPAYAPGFQQMQAALTSGKSSLDALTAVYAKSPEAITRDLHVWFESGRLAPLQSTAIRLGSTPMEVSEIPGVESRLLIADALLTAGELDRAEALYRALESEASRSAEISAALGTIGLRRGDSGAARLEWRRAIDRGVADASLCYRYAMLAEQAGAPPGEVRTALERAVALKPDFDDARYRLALLEKNAGDYAQAVANLRAMTAVSPGRAYAYWIALADALNELGAREEAKAAALQAQKHATTSSERSNASELAYVAETDFGVQFARDANGRAQIVTTRVPHQAAHWNPFIEVGDDLRRTEGVLREIDCSGETTRFVVESGGRRLRLAIPDPTRVEMRNAPAEFVCGTQPVTAVTVEYAASASGDGLIRGMEFR